MRSGRGGEADMSVDHNAARLNDDESGRQKKRAAFAALSCAWRLFQPFFAGAGFAARSLATSQLAVLSMPSKPWSGVTLTRYLPLTMRVGVPSTPPRCANCLARLSLAVTPKLFMAARNLSLSTPHFAYIAAMSSAEPEPAA